MKILFAMHFEPGHHLGTFRLAKTLRSRGHSVAYLGTPHMRALVERQGFEFVEFAGHLFSEQKASPQGPHEERAAAEALFNQYVAAITDGTLDQSLLAAEPDLLICDSFLWYVAIRARRLQLPVLQISTSLFLHKNSRIPPTITHVPPGEGLLSRLRVSLSWELMFLKFIFTKRLASRLYGAFRAPTRMHHLVDVFQHVAKASDFPLQRNVTYLYDEIGAHLILPEIVLCTKSFQFPGPLPEERTYCGDFIDFQREEPPLPFDPTGKTIVFCSLGTSAGAYPHSERFFEAVAEASRQVPDYFFVLHISDSKLIDRFSSTNNLFVTAWISQLALLQHAAVMVNHGGLNSIMECIQYEVPMVILPCARDQPGNAARAAYHQVALTGDSATIDANQLIALITNVHRQPELKANVRRMKAQIEEENGLEHVVPLIENYPSSAQTNPPLVVQP